MLVPAAMHIEAATDSLKQKKSNSKDNFWIKDELKELASARGETTDDLQEGYLLGLETARVVLMMSGTLVSKGVKAADLL